jgi:hypothetical protein
MSWVEEGEDQSLQQNADVLYGLRPPEIALLPLGPNHQFPRMCSQDDYFSLEFKLRVSQRPRELI